MHPKPRKNTHKQDNKDIWETVKPLIAGSARKDALKVTWTKGHATEEDIAKGKTNQEDKIRNIAVDKLASEGIKMNEADGDIVNVAKQRKISAALHQIRLVKMWRNRQELAACDQAEQHQMDEEAAAIVEMEEVIKGKEKDP